jgi:predicted membrane protein
MVGTPLEAMMVASLSTVISDPLIEALLVLCLFGGFAIIGGGGFDRKVAIMVTGAILAACLVPWMFVLLSIIVGAVLIYPVFRRIFQ